MAYASPVDGDGGPAGSYPIFHMPVAISVARGFQIFFSFVVMVMAGLVMHGHVFSAEAFAFVCGLFTLVVALYAVLSEKVASCRNGYNYWAVFALDLTMLIFWLSSMAANAALRATFNVKTSATCVDDGSTVNADTCYYKRELAKRTVYFASNGALAIMSALSGVSAIQMLIFAATFGYLAHQIRMHRQAESRGVESDDAGVVEMKTPATTATTVPAYDATGYVGASGVGGGGGGGGGYAEMPGPAPTSTQQPYATYDYPSAGAAPDPAVNYNYGQPQQQPQPAQAQYAQHTYAAPAAAPAAAPGAGQYYGPQ